MNKQKDLKSIMCYTNVLIPYQDLKQMFIYYQFFIFSLAHSPMGLGIGIYGFWEAAGRVGWCHFAEHLLMPVVGKLEGGEPSAGEWLFLRCSVNTAELFVCFRLGFYVCFVGVFPPNPLEQISASPS